MRGLLYPPSRSQVLQKAKSAYSNYRAGYDGLKRYFENIPNYEPQENDHVSQVETKLKKQQVIRQLGGTAKIVQYNSIQSIAFFGGKTKVISVLHIADGLQLSILNKA